MAVWGFTYNQEPITHYRPLQTLFFLHFCSYLYGKCNTFVAIKQIKLKHFRFIAILAHKYYFIAHTDWHIKQWQ